jgi:hypothetical protein
MSCVRVPPAARSRCSRLGVFAEDQKGFDEASHRLEQTLHALERSGLEARGEIGDADPLQAADDGLRQFPANEIIFVTHPQGRTKWLEDGVVALAESRYDQPVRHIEVAAG